MDSVAHKSGGVEMQSFFVQIRTLGIRRCGSHLLKNLMLWFLAYEFDLGACLYAPRGEDRKTHCLSPEKEVIGVCPRTQGFFFDLVGRQELGAYPSPTRWLRG